VGHRFEHGERQPLHPRRENQDVDLSERRRCVGVEAGETNPVCQAERSGEAFELDGIRSVGLDVVPDQHDVRIRTQLRERFNQLTLALHRCEPPDVPKDDRGRGKAELATQARRGRLAETFDVDAVVDCFKLRAWKALLFERESRRIGDGEQPFAEAGRRVVERGQRRRCESLGAKVVLDVEVRDDGGARRPGCDATEHGSCNVDVRVQNVHVQPA